MLAPLVGDTLTYRVPNLNPGKSACLDFFPISAVVKAVGTRALIVQDVATPTGGFTTTDFNDIVARVRYGDLLDRYDVVWSTQRPQQRRGGHDPLHARGEQAHAAGAAGFTAGFFFRADLFTKAEFQQAGPALPHHE